MMEETDVLRRFGHPGTVVYPTPGCFENGWVCVESPSHKGICCWACWWKQSPGQTRNAGTAMFGGSFLGGYFEAVFQCFSGIL